MSESAREPIAYVARTSGSHAVWLKALAAAMPGERLVEFAALANKERRAVRVAVVADPDPDELARLPALEWVHSTWAGVERLVNALPDHVGLVRMTDPRLADTMAEAVLTAVLWLHRDGPRYARQQRCGIWEEAPFRRAEDRTVGILGLGALGRRSAERVRDAGFATLGWSRAPKMIPGVTSFAGGDGLVDMLGRCDIAVCLLPHTPQTEGLLSATALAALGGNGALVNFGRGALVDETALLSALNEGRLGEAFLDVFATEPLPAGHPFWNHERVTVWPHVSAPTDPTSASRIVAGNVARWRREGALPQVVDRARGY